MWSKLSVSTRILSLCGSFTPQAPTYARRSRGRIPECTTQGTVTSRCRWLKPSVSRGPRAWVGRSRPRSASPCALSQCPHVYLTPLLTDECRSTVRPQGRVPQHCALIGTSRQMTRRTDVSRCLQHACLCEGSSSVARSCLAHHSPCSASNTQPHSLRRRNSSLIPISRSLMRAWVSFCVHAA